MIISVTQYYDLIIEIDSILLTGDSGYPLEPWLLTPILDAADGSPESHYNNAHISGRGIIERLNGTLKSRFRCLLKHRTLHYAPQKAAQIINACAVLHNMCIEDSVQWETNHHDLDTEDLPFNQGDGGNLTRQPRTIRDSIVRSHFS